MIPPNIDPDGDADGKRDWFKRAPEISYLRLETADPVAIATPPVVENLPAEFVQSTTATLRASILDDGGVAPDITVFYGTVDGSTDPDAWESSEIRFRLGGDRPIPFPLTELTPDTKYFYRARAANLIGEDWADASATFTTPVTDGPRAPSVFVLPATIIDGNSAVLTAFADTGGATTTVFFFWGTSDGGTNDENWDQVSVVFADPDYYLFSYASFLDAR